MKHARGMSAITNPLVNSYKRLVPGYEAPVYIAWSAKNSHYGYCRQAWNERLGKQSS